MLIVGASGQLGKALQVRYPEAKAVDIDSLDIGNLEAVQAFDWAGVKVILNAAAYTNVDGAENPEGRAVAWTANAVAPRNLATVAAKHEITLVHISTDYVFDGTRNPHTEDEPFAPLSVYGASKAAGDIAVSTLEKHFILRTSWVIGDGKNFVKTMLDLAQKGVSPTVVSDQIGRLTFTSTLVEAIDHLLSNLPGYGTYNVTNDGESASWAEITREIYKISGLPNTVTDQTTSDYFQNKPECATRPLQSTLDLTKITAAGFAPKDWKTDLIEYLNKELL